MTALPKAAIEAAATQLHKWLWKTGVPFREAPFQHQEFCRRAAEDSILAGLPHLGEPAAWASVSVVEDFRDKPWRSPRDVWGQRTGGTPIPLFLAPVPLPRPIPDGWKLVPLFPTDGMLTAGIKAWISSQRHTPQYQAMVAAAPEPPVASHPADAGKTAEAERQRVRNAALEDAAQVVERMDRSCPVGAGDGCGTRVVMPANATAVAAAVRALARPIASHDVASGEPDVTPSSAEADVMAERRRQIAKGYTAEHDDGHNYGDLARAGACFALTRAWRCIRARGHFDEIEQPIMTVMWPWPDTPPKIKVEPRDRLVRAAALIIAEIERLDRKDSVHEKDTSNV